MQNKKGLTLAQLVLSRWKRAALRMYFLSVVPPHPTEYEQFTAATSDTPAKIPTASRAPHDAVGPGKISIHVEDF